jgi:hypothetical protein
MPATLEQPTSAHQTYSAPAGHNPCLPASLALCQPGLVLQPWITRGFLTVAETTAPCRQPWITRGGLQITFDEKALCAYSIRDGEKVPGLAAAWLYELRGRLVGSGGEAAWCVCCGTGCRDSRPKPPTIRRWCDACGRLRFRPEWRQCAASTCDQWFRATRKDQYYCTGESCSKPHRRRVAAQAQWAAPLGTSPDLVPNQRLIVPDRAGSASS